jgi:hypothetical protein
MHILIMKDKDGGTAYLTTHSPASHYGSLPRASMTVVLPHSSSSRRSMMVRLFIPLKTLTGADSKKPYAVKLRFVSRFIKVLRLIGVYLKKLYKKGDKNYE